MTWNTSKQQGTKHNDACTRAFTNLSPLGCCPRCDELELAVSPGLAGIMLQKRRKRLRQELLQHISRRAVSMTRLLR